MMYDTALAPVDLPGPYDVCIAGGGVAGIVLATTMADKGKRVLLLEGGGLEISEQSQDLYKGRITGKEYIDLDVTRLRFLGGSSNHWGGRCYPLAPQDFERRDYIPDSGWPISYDDVRRHQARAAEILEIEDFPDPRVLAHTDGNLAEIDFRKSQVRFGEKYREVLATSDRIDVVLNANVTDATLDTETGRIRHLSYRGHAADSPVRQALATRFVIAMGGLENPRFLLNATGQRPDGLGNEHGLVGRYFMEHPTFTLGIYIVNPDKSDFGRELRYLVPTRTYADETGIGNCHIRLRRVRDVGYSPDSWKERVDATICGNEILYDIFDIFGFINCPRDKNAGYLRGSCEQVPNAESRVTLTDDRDALGMRRIALDWRLTPAERTTLKSSALEVGRFLARSDYGRIRLDKWMLEDRQDLPGLADDQETLGNHHMGTTRMGHSARDGVVDANCRVFGTENLYMAGSSVFRTVGHANPTFTIVQLALRLADHLARA